jgi:glucose/arabinose dehydrogenase
VPIADGLVRPWSIGFLPDGATMLVTEAQGRIRMIRDDVLVDTPVWEAPAAPEGADQANSRIRALAVHPDFERNGLIYVAHVKWGERGSTLAVSRGRFDGGTLAAVEEIFVADAWETSGNLGGRLLFGPDGTLYVTVGDRDRLCCVGHDDPSLRMKAQGLDTHVGKTLRIRDDGGVPSDNPFVGRADAKPEIFTYGHRNGYGLSFHPETGALWQAEIGPLGGDEVNVLMPGRNYGWPLVSTGRNYTGTHVSDQPWARPGMENPRIHWVPSISPSSIAFYTGDRFPSWKGSLFVGALTTRELERVSFGNPSQDERRERLLVPFGLRVRDVAEGPDGLLYIATESALAASTRADGAILRIEPAD